MHSWVPSPLSSFCPHYGRHHLDFSSTWATLFAALPASVYFIFRFVFHIAHGLTPFLLFVLGHRDQLVVEWGSEPSGPTRGRTLREFTREFHFIFQKPRSVFRISWAQGLWGCARSEPNAVSFLSYGTLSVRNAFCSDRPQRK
jgi:hypothetical protein